MKSVQSKIERALARAIHKRMLAQLPESLLIFLAEEATKSQLDRKLKASWERHAGMSLYDFSKTFPELTQVDELARSVFTEDMTDHRLHLDIQPLTPDKYDEMRVKVLDDVPSLESAIEQFAESTMRLEFKNMVWPLPRHGLFGQILEDIDELDTLGNETALSQTLETDIELMIEDLEAQIESMDNYFTYARDEKLNGYPYRHKPRPENETKRKDNSALLPHTDPLAAFVFVWKGAATILFKHDDLDRVEGLRCSLPRKTGPLSGYEITQTPSLLMMPMFQPHMGNRRDDRKRITSRAFMLEGQKILDGIHAPEGPA